MKKINAFLTLLLVVALYSCTKYPPIEPPVVKDSSYLVTESFESGKKSSVCPG